MPSVITTGDSRVPDAVWESLDPEAGSLSRRTRHSLWLLEAVVLVVVAVMLALHASGVGKARISVELSSVQLPTGAHPFPATVRVFNHGSVTATISKIGTSQGLAVASAPGQPITVKPHGTVTVQVQLTLRDCATATQTAPRLSVRVEQFWGHWAARTQSGSADLLADVVSQACAAAR